MTSARLPEDLEYRLEISAKEKHITKTELVKEAVTAYLDQGEEGKSSWELGEAYFGRYGSGDGALSMDYKKRIKEKLHSKHPPY